MVKRVQIKTKGIKNILTKINIPQAVSEYIWNGFDAGATKVELNYEPKENGNLRKLIIIDNGFGIPEDQLDKKFGPFHQSEKIQDETKEKNKSLPHGYRGIGRLTFYQFANFAKWATIYSKNGKNHKYQIEVNSDNLENYLPKSEDIVDEPVETDEPIGTIVEFDGFIIIHDNRRNVCEEIIRYLKREFCWFLELFQSRGYSLKINGKELDYSPIIIKNISKTYEVPNNRENFNVKYVLWDEMINKEYSYYYYLDNDGNELFKETTTLNNQGDNFYHSVYVSSDYFKNFYFSKIGDDKQKAISENMNSETFKYLKSVLEKELYNLRKPFLKENSSKIVDEFAQYNVDLVIREGDDDFVKFKKEELRNVVCELYQIQPKIFAKLNIEQKRTFIGLLKLLLDSDERDSLISIIGKVIDLSREERQELDNILKTNQLNRIVKTIKLISGRYRVVEALKQLVFNHDFGANERNHLQPLIKNNYWIFGEQYSLASADEDFQSALKKYLYVLDEKERDTSLEHENKKDRMDIFLCKRDLTSDSNHNIIVELKHPTNIRLGEKEVSQVKRYMRTIRSIDEFNDPTSKWDFILVGNKFDSTDYIQYELKSMEKNGRSGLIHEPDGQFSFYVKTWSQIVNEFEKRHDFLNKKLKIEKKSLIKEAKSADELIQIAKNK
ncbi:DNA topoisomerase VI, subunit B [Methanophagales archaeon]|nr:DNA topoisomerase VI, subunit B [Methanophagales archaeon]